MLPDWLPPTETGATVGSGIAVALRPGRDGILRLLFRWTVGVFVSWSSTGGVVAWLHVPDGDDVRLFVASTLGIVGYSLVQLALSPEFRAALVSMLPKAKRK